MNSQFKAYVVGSVLISSLFTVNSPSLALTVNETINLFGGLTTATSASAFFSQYTGSNDQLNPIGITTSNGFSWSFQGLFDNKPLELNYTGTLTSPDPTTNLLSWTGNGTYNGFNYTANGNITFFATINGFNIDFTSFEEDDLLLSNGSDFFRQSYTLQGIGNLTLQANPEIQLSSSDDSQVSQGDQTQSGNGTQIGNQSGGVNVTLNIDARSSTTGSNSIQQNRQTSTSSETVIESKTAKLNPDGTTTFQDAKATIKTKIPEPTSTLSLLVLSTLGIASTLKRKLKPSNSLEKEIKKVS
jgi:hypothetical protein